MRTDKALASKYGIPKWLRRYAIRYGTGMQAAIQMDLQMRPRQPFVPIMYKNDEEIVQTIVVKPLSWWERLKMRFYRWRSSHD